MHTALRIVGLYFALGGPLVPVNALAQGSGACEASVVSTVLVATGAAPAHARAVWLDSRTLRWPVVNGAPNGGRGRFVLYASASGRLEVAAGQPVRGASDSVVLRTTADSLPLAVRARTRHVGSGVTLRAVVTQSRGRMAALLSSQFVLIHEDASGAVLDATYTQPALALDALYADAAERLPFGANPRGAVTRFSLWAPTARAVSLCTNGTAARALPMTRDPATGAWHVDTRGAAHGTRYRYAVELFVPGVGLVRNLVTDPWSLALTANSTHSVVADLSHPSLIPQGWRTRRAPPLAHPVDQVIYELHVRDFSVSDERVPAEHRGRYLAFTDTASHGSRHLRALARAGFTDVHLLPVFDFATVPEQGCGTPIVSGTPAGEAQQATVTAAAARDCYNWGYDPLHFTVPEGSYATDADAFGARIVEFRRMVMALNAAGLRVGMDVVYNHTSASGQSPRSVLDRVVPGYYHRLNADGAVETSTCCANTATEHRLMAALMIASVTTWVREYGISSFRFDLMGHQPRDVMERLQREANRAAGTLVPLIGEGWNFGEVANNQRFVQASQLALQGSGIATFSDRARDAIRGGSALDTGADLVRNAGWVNGMTDPFRRRQHADQIRVGLAGSLATYRMTTANGESRALRELSYNGQPAGYVQQPAEVVNYVENHDNPTLFDINVLRLPRSTSRDDRARVQLLASALVLFSQGIAYVHAGQELLRSKSLDRNSFDSGDWFNHYDVTGATHGFARGLPPKQENEAAWPFMRPLLADTGIAPMPSLVHWTRDAVFDLVRIRASSSLFRLRSAAEVAQRLRFVNVGPDQNAMVLAAHISGAAAPARLPGARFHDLLYAVNADTVEQHIRVPSLAKRALQLHPVHLAATAADERPRQSRWNTMTGELTIPPRTAVVWVSP